MSVEQVNSVEDRVLLILKGFLGPHAHVDHDKLVGQELGISGGDSVELLDELEAEFGVDLNDLIQKSTFHLRPTWFDRLLGKKEGRPVADVTVRDLIRYIENTTV